MGATLEVVGEGQGRCPHSFTQSDSKVLLSYLTEHAWGVGDLPDVLATIEEELAISLEPPTRLGDAQQSSREDMLAEGATEEDWLKEVARHEASWQEPAIVVQCVEAMVQGLRGNPRILVEVEADLDDEASEYFRDGSFLQDLEDLARMARWAQSSGSARLRLAIS